MSTLLLALFLGVVVAALVAPQAPPRVHGDGHPGPGWPATSG